MLSGFTETKRRSGSKVEQWERGWDGKVKGRQKAFLSIFIDRKRVNLQRMEHTRTRGNVSRERRQERLENQRVMSNQSGCTISRDYHKCTSSASAELLTTEYYTHRWIY